MADLEATVRRGLIAASRAEYGLYAWGAFLLHTVAAYALVRPLAFGRGREAFIGRQFHRWARRNMTWAPFPVRVEGAPHLVRPCVLAVNHIHFFDVCAIAALVPPPMRFVARVEVMHVPLVRSVLRLGGHLTVRRGGGRANRATFETAARLMDEGSVIAFFPEGTRSRDGHVGALRSGAFRLAAESGRPLVPLVLAGTEHTIPGFPGPILPARLAASFLPPRPVRPADAGSRVWREDLRAEMERELVRIRAWTGPGL